MNLPTFEDEVEYAVEAFEDAHDRPPTEDELEVIKAEARDKVNESQEALASYEKRSGAKLGFAEVLDYERDSDPVYMGGIDSDLLGEY